MSERKYARHYEKSIVINADQSDVFVYADNPRNFSSHMNQTSIMMAGSTMQTEIDEEEGKKVGSHIKMDGKVLGVPLSLDEVIIERNPPHSKAWETVGDINLLVIDHYKLGFDITPSNGQSDLNVHIDYNFPQSKRTQWVGRLFGGMYAQWCVTQMVKGVSNHFNKK